MKKNEIHEGISNYLDQSIHFFHDNSLTKSQESFHKIIKINDFEHAEIGIVGIPDDVGVSLSKGRIGSKDAPNLIRKQLSKYGTTYNIDYNVDLSDLKISDFGNIIVETNNQSETYQRIRIVINEFLNKKIIPLVLGGGHDITYPCIDAFSKQYKRIGGLNIDVHFDVREQNGKLVSSGMPFRKILEDISDKPLNGENFVEIGADGNVNSYEHWKYLTERNVTIYSLKYIRDFIRKYGKIEPCIEQALMIAAKNTNAIFVSLDIDSVSSTASPGCSFINPNGFSTDEISRIAYTIGLNKKVKYFDIVEVNPTYDIDNRTTRLCARIICYFLAGYMKR